MIKYLLGALAALMLMSCDNATAETPAAKPQQIQCYSGGILIYSGSSVGDISNDISGDHYLTFTEEGSGKFKAVSGDCIVVFD